MLALITIIAAALQAASASSPSPSTKDIVVTGRRIPELKDDLAKCLARKCPVGEDVKASLALAEGQFVGGNSNDARDTLRSASLRNRKYAKTAPVLVSGLYRARARLADHDGNPDEDLASTLDSYSALKAGLPDTDPHVIAESIELADMFARQNRVDTALARYRGAIADAHKANLPLLEGSARFRIVVLYTALQWAASHSSDPGSVNARSYDALLRKESDALAATTDPAIAPFRTAAAMLPFLKAAKSGDETAIRRIADMYRSQATETPLLIYTPPEKSADGRDQLDADSQRKNGSTDVDDQWIDISFWVTPTGGVSDVSTLRASPAIKTWWVAPILQSIAGRRYAPLKMAPTDPGVLRVERYTRTADRGYDTNAPTRIQSRTGRARVTMIDLTEPDRTTAAASPRPAG